MLYKKLALAHFEAQTAIQFAPVCTALCTWNELQTMHVDANNYLSHNNVKKNNVIIYARDEVKLWQ